MTAQPINALAIIDVTAIRTDGRNVRDDLGDLTELAASIRAVGILQPLTVTPAGGGRYDLVHGTDRTVLRVRQRLDLPTNFPQDRQERTG